MDATTCSARDQAALAATHGELVPRLGRGDRLWRAKPLHGVLPRREWYSAPRPNNRLPLPSPLGRAPGMTPRLRSGRIWAHTLGGRMRLMVRRLMEGVMAP